MIPMSSVGSNCMEAQVPCAIRWTQPVVRNTLLEGGELTAHDGAVYLTSRALKMQTP